MTPLLVALVLGAALLHAVWNAVLRSGADRLRAMAIMSITSTVLAIPFVFLLPGPREASWRFLALSATLQVAYRLFLVRAYRDAALAQAYPIARGTSPLLVTVGAVVFAGERLAPFGLAGVALVSLGIMALAFGGARPTGRSTLAAIASGVCIAAYTVTDGLGARASGHPVSYAAWLFLLEGVPTPLIVLAVRGPYSVSLKDRETLKAAAGGALSMLAYGVVVYALTLGPMGQVSALRETSILFAAVIGVVFLREPATWRRLAAAAAIAAGAVMLSV